MNRRQRKKQIKQKIENNEVISVSDYRFIEKHCPELQKTVLLQNINLMKDAVHNIGKAFSEAITQMTPIIQKFITAVVEGLRQAAENESEVDDETEE